MSHQTCDEALEQAWNRIEELEKENEFLKAQIAHWDVVLTLCREYAESGDTEYPDYWGSMYGQNENDVDERFGRWDSHPSVVAVMKRVGGYRGEL